MTTGKAIFPPPSGRLARWRRRVFVAAMRRLGYPRFVARAHDALFVVDPTDLIDRSIALFGEWETEQLEDLAQACRASAADCFLDLGANAGFYSVVMARHRLVPEVIAFEPDPGNYAHLLANLHVNDLTGRVTPFPYALGDRAGSVTLWEARAENRGESWIAHADKPPEEAPVVRTHVVQQVRLDDVLALTGRTLVVKMDVEGSEFHTLAGMRRTLAENRCYLQIELYSERIAELKGVFDGLGYRYLRTRGIDHYFTNIAGIG